MKRKLYEKIKKLDKNEGKKLITVSGMRGTGKTYSILEYVKKEYGEYLYIDPAHNEGFNRFFKNFDKKSLRSLIADFFQIGEEYLLKIPVVIDEPEGDTAPDRLLIGYEWDFKLFIISSDGSPVSIPEDRQEESGHIETGPLNYGDFLLAIEKEWFEEIIEGHLISQKRIPSLIHQELLDLYDLYKYTGGMPEVINEYLRLGTVENVREKQISLKNSLWYDLLLKAGKQTYHSDDMAQAADKASGSGYEISPSKIQGILEAVERILVKENHKFMYSAIREGVTRRSYEKSLDFLLSHGILIKIGRLDRDPDTDFRLYYSDPSFYEKMNEDIVHESVMIQGIYSSGAEICYWESGKGASFNCVRINGELYPIDSHSIGRGNLRSIRRHFGDKKVLRLSDENCRFEEDKITIPIYASYALKYVFQQ